MIEKIVKPFITPIVKKIVIPLKRVKSLPKLLAKWVKKKFKETLAQKETTKASYVRFGNYYVSKKLLVIVILIILALYYFIFIKPPKLVNQWLHRVPAITASADGAVPDYSGEVKLYSPDGVLLYTGQLAEGKFEGEGKRYRPDGTVIEQGSYKQGLLVQGSRFNEQEHLVYTGGFAAGQYEGTGTLYDGQGHVKYKGEFKAGVPSGTGQSFAEAGKLIYEGGFASGVYSGDGAEYNPDGQLVYRGHFLAGKYNGTGKKLYAGGNVQYEGSFSNGMPSGDGIEYDEKGTVKYEGRFLSNVYNGNGTLYRSNGTIKYAGGFLGGKYHGEGKLYNEQGVLEYKGEFANGALSGYGIWYQDGATVLYQGFFQQGEPSFAPYLGMSPARLQELLGKPTAVDVINASLTVPALPVSTGEGIGSGADPAVRLRYQELRTSFIARLDEGSGEAAVKEIQLGRSPVLERLGSLLEQRSASKEPQVQELQVNEAAGGQQKTYIWNHVVYQILVQEDGKPSAGTIRQEEKPPM